MADRPSGLVISRRVAGAVSWTIVAGALLVLLTQLVGTPNRSIAVLQALTPWVAVPLLAVVLDATLRRRPHVGDAAAAIAIAYLALMAPLAVTDRGPSPADGAPTVTLMSINVLYSNDDYDAVGDAVATIDPDVVAFSEVTHPIADGLEALDVAARYPHRVVEPGSAASGLMLWSRLPLAAVDRAATLSRSIDATATAPGGPLRLIVMHPPPPVLDADRWSHDLGSIADIVADDGVPTAVLGDLNASYFHPPFRAALADADLRDALRAAGDALTFTWPTGALVPPFVTLDHILVDDRLAVVHGEVVPVEGSDHAAVSATIAPAA